MYIGKWRYELHQKNNPKGPDGRNSKGAYPDEDSLDGSEEEESEEEGLPEELDNAEEDAENEDEDDEEIF